MNKLEKEKPDENKKEVWRNPNEPLFEGDLILERFDGMDVSIDYKKEETVYFLIYRDKLLFFKDQSKKLCEGVLFFDDPPRAQWILKTDKNQGNAKITGIKFLGDPKTLRTIFPIENSGIFFNEFKEAIYRNFFVTPFLDFYKPIKKIGKGSFALVYLFEEKSTGKKFAVKAFNKESTFSKKNGKESILNEIKVMRALNNKNIINLREIYETDNSIYMVMDLIEDGQLLSLLGKNKKLPINVARHVLKQIIEGVNHFHELNIMHRDLKPQNILIKNRESLEVCIVDFGLATKCDEECYIFVRCGTPGYVAPEIMNIGDNSTARYEKSCDIFSVGIIFHLMLMGYSPFDSYSPKEIFRLNRKCKIDLDSKEYKQLPSTAFDLLSKMLRKDPTERISAHECLLHDFFAPENLEEELWTSHEILAGESIGKIVFKEGTFDMLRKTEYFNSGTSPRNMEMLSKHHRVKSMDKRDEIKGNLFEDSLATFEHRTSLFTGQTDTVTSIQDKYSPFLRKTPESLMNSPIQSMVNNTKFGNLVRKPNINNYEDRSETRIMEEDEMINSMNKSMPKRTIFTIKSSLKTMI